MIAYLLPLTCNLDLGSSVPIPIFPVPPSILIIGVSLVILRLQKVFWKKRFLLLSQNNFHTVEKVIRLQYSDHMEENYVKPAHALLSGRIYHRKNSFEVFARIVNTKTGLVLFGKDVFIESKNRSDLYTIAEILSEKIVHEFPMVDGSIHSVNKNHFVVKASNSKLKLTMPTHIYQTNNPVRISGSDTQILSTGFIDELFKNKYVGKFTNENLMYIQLISL
jgi:hypothetical protein